MVARKTRKDPMDAERSVKVIKHDASVGKFDGKKDELKY
jgi:hypothetical protein